jgi:hypothetical protein
VFAEIGGQPRLSAHERLVTAHDLGELTQALNSLGVLANYQSNWDWPAALYEISEALQWVESSARLMPNHADEQRMPVRKDEQAS